MSNPRFEHDFPLFETFAERNMRLAHESGDMSDLERAKRLREQEKLGQLASVDVSSIPDLALDENDQRTYDFFVAAAAQQRAFRVGDQVELEKQNHALLQASENLEHTE